MKKWLAAQFNEAHTAFASAMAIVGALGTLSCSAIGCIVLMHQGL